VHYTTTQFDKLASLPIGDLAADDCVMFMWTVDWAPQQALDLIAHYGFLHKTTAFTWAKQNESGQDWHMGQGYWTRANPEACWLATRGNPKRLHADVRQLMFHPVTAHSEKPDAVFERIERLVAGPYLDIFARKPRPGWTCWGNEHFSQAMAGQPLAGDSCARDGDSACALEESASISPSGALSAIAALAANESDDVQRYLLLHDWSEHLFGDDTTPKKRALSAIATSFGILSGEIERAFAMLTERADAVIHARLGLAWPAPPSIAERVHYWDRVMLATEWRDLMRCPPPYDFGVTPIGRRITPTLDWRADMQLLRQHVATLFPDAR
jgi:N6-adenosine-specific RNA methylase IME4